MKFFQTDSVSCNPISTLNDLLSWSSETASKFHTHKLNESYYTNSANVPKFLVCHDMRNNYLEDKYFQGSNYSTTYTFYHWNLIDTFIYFSHHFVTIPPESWINAAHENNCRMLGTFITEFDQGIKICDQLFENLDQVIEILVNITVHFGFDGWLINIENPVKCTQKLTYFVKSLTQKLKEKNDKLYQVIWYDSVLHTGELKWQNELNELNKQYFELTDGFFVNYTWKENNLVNCVNNSGQRFRDVYVGIDVFGRGCLGDGGFNTHVAVAEIFKKDLSYALFAPGWIHECNDETKFYDNSDKFWSLLLEYTNRRKIKHFPILTTFSHASGENFFVQGQKFNNKWNNLNLQSLIPIMKNSSWNFEDAFYGANSLNLLPGEHNLFDLELNLNEGRTYVFDYVFKSDGQFRFMIETEDVEWDVCLQSSNLNIIETIEYSIGDWKMERVVFIVDKTVPIKTIKVRNQGVLNLGLLRFYEKQETRSISLKLDPNYEARYFKLNNQIYLMVRLILPDMVSKYYNVFLNQNSKEKNLTYVGSSKKNEFYLCLKLNQNVCIDSNSELNLEVLIQQVDKYYDNLLNTSNGLNESETVSLIPIKIPRLRVCDDKSFVNEVIYDLEIF